MLYDFDIYKPVILIVILYRYFSIQKQVINHDTYNFIFAVSSILIATSYFMGWEIGKSSIRLRKGVLMDFDMIFGYFQKNCVWIGLNELNEQSSILSKIPIMHNKIYNKHHRELYEVIV